MNYPAKVLGGGGSLLLLQLLVLMVATMAIVAAMVMKMTMAFFLPGFITENVKGKL